MARRLRVLLVYGGRSAEHDVSRATAVAVARALDPDRYEIVPVAITTDGRWLLADRPASPSSRVPTRCRSEFAVDGEPAEGLGRWSRILRDTLLPPRATFDVDVVLPLLHGPYGEDGTVQGLFELADLPYVGSGVVGSAVAMDKIMMKRTLRRAAQLPTPRHRSFRDGHDLDAFLDEVEGELGYPCFVKPANMGSSVGVSKASDRAAVRESCELALSFDEWIVAGR